MPDCTNIIARRIDPTDGPQHQCAIVAQISGMPNVWLSDDCLGTCSGDDGSSACTLTINSTLRLRVSALWDRTQPDDCVGSLSLDAAFALILSRSGQAVAEAALEDAVAGGMPLAQAEALATANGIALE